MQLHKLLYYAQGWSLATRGCGLFVAPIKAWTHGPVVAELRPRFANFGSDPIPATEASEEGLNDADRAFVWWVWKRYGRYTGAFLRQLTHREPPWREARGTLPEGARSDATIDENRMKEHFGVLHQKQCERAGLSADRLSEARQEARNGKLTPISEL